MTKINRIECECGNVMTYTILDSSAWFSVSGVRWAGLNPVCQKCGKYHTLCNECGTDLFVDLGEDVEHLCPSCEVKKKEERRRYLQKYPYRPWDSERPVEG